MHEIFRMIENGDADFATAGKRTVGVAPRGALVPDGGLTVTD